MSVVAHRVLLALILVIALIFGAQCTSSDELSSYEAVPLDLQHAGEAIIGGEGQLKDWQTLTTLFTAALLHGSVSHIATNMLFLWIFAGLVGELLGWRWMLAIFCITAICGTIGDAILRHGSEIPVIGASGALMGFEAAYLGLAVRWSLPNPWIWPIAHPIPPLNLAILAVGSFFLDISGVAGPDTGIAYGAHLGGFLAGLFLTCFVTPKPKTI